MNQKYEQSITRLLLGAYDLHIHAAPSPFGRKLDEYGLLRAADQVGMAGILLKSHYESTAARAQLVNKHVQAKAKAYPMCRKTPCFSYGDIRHFHRIYASN